MYIGDVMVVLTKCLWNEDEQGEDVSIVTGKQIGRAHV